MAEPSCVLSDVDAEISVISASLAGGKAVLASLPELTGSDFSDERNQAIYNAITAIYDGSGMIDPITVIAELTKQNTLAAAGGASNVSHVASRASGFSTAPAHARIVLAASSRRRMLAISAGLDKGIRAGTDVIELSSRAVAALNDLSAKGSEAGPVHAKDTVKEVYKEIEELAKSGRKPGISTGLKSLDDITFGFRPCELTILGARSSMGKTALGIQLAVAAERDTAKAVVIFSLEQSAGEIIRRIMASQGKVSATRIATARLKDAEYPRMSKIMGEIAESDLWIDDSPALSIAQIRARSHGLNTKHPLGLIVIDYLGLVSSRGQSREREVAAISAGLKALAKELYVPVLVLAQLNRSCEQREGAAKRPRMSDLRDSGSQEQDADVVLGLHRPDYYDKKDRPGEADLEVLKGRNCGTGSLVLKWEPEILRFSEPVATPRKAANETQQGPGQAGNSNRRYGG